MRPANGLTEDSLLQIGQVIKIPGVDDTATAASSAAIPARNHGDDRNSGEHPARPRQPSPTLHPAGAPSVYTVRIGDTLFGIAIRYDITRRALAEANGITETDQVVVAAKVHDSWAGRRNGQRILVKHGVGCDGNNYGNACGRLRNRDDFGNAASTTSTSAATIPAATASTRYYTVQSGDTIISIALANNVDWQEVLRLNGMTETSLLQIGQKIRLNSGIRRHPFNRI